MKIELIATSWLISGHRDECKIASCHMHIRCRDTEQQIEDENFEMTIVMLASHWWQIANGKEMRQSISNAMWNHDLQWFDVEWKIWLPAYSVNGFLVGWTTSQTAGECIRLVCRFVVKMCNKRHLLPVWTYHNIVIILISTRCVRFICVDGCLRQQQSVKPCFRLFL